MNLTSLILASLALLAATGCTTTRRPRPVTAPHVDLTRFMGDWHVLASIPLWPERNAFDGVESYALDDRERIRTTYTFRKGGFDGPLKTYRPVARVHNRETNAEWKMQFLWPFEADYLIHHVSADYTETIIGEPGLDYLWIMARSASLPTERLDALIARAKDIGYDTGRIRLVPQSGRERSGGPSK